MTVFAPPAEWTMQFAQNGAGSVAPLTNLIGQRAMSWATAPVPGVGAGFYMPAYRDPLSTTATATATNPHDLTWFYNNHPDWLVYQNSATSTPSTGGSGNLWGINIHLQEVLDYMLAYALDPSTVGGVASTTAGVLNGNAYLSVDNVTAQNLNNIEGYYLGATPGVGSPPDFGGVWTQLYTGADNDQAWANDSFALCNYLRANLNKIGVGVWLNSKLSHTDIPNSIKQAQLSNAVLRESAYQHACTLNSTISSISWAAGTVTVNTTGAHGLTSGYVVGVWGNTPTGYNTPAAAVTVVNATRFTYPLVADPGASTIKGIVGNTDFVDSGTRGTDWYAALQLANTIHDRTVIVQFDYLCGHPMAQATNAEISYACANYYLTRGKRTYLEMQNGTSTGGRDDGTLTTYPAPFLVALGEPLEDPPIAGTPNSGGGCYKRAYQFGMAVVWPNITSSGTYTVPADGNSWMDQFGNPVAAGVHTLGPDTSVTPNRANGIVLYWTP